jgi:tetratricopeptide (TPR) repeat protein
MEIGFMIFRLRPGLLFLLSGFFVLGAASLCFAQDGETEMTNADSINKAKRHLSFGGMRYNAKEYEDAETQLLKSWAYNPASGQTARFLGKLYNKAEKYDEAINWYRKAIEVEPKSKYTKGAYSDLAGVYITQEQPEEAIGCYEALLESSLEPEEKIKNFHSLVSLSVEVEDYEKALDCAKLWGELAPDDPEVRDMIAKLHLRTGGEDEALVEMEKMMEMSPDDYVTLETLAGMYTNRGDYDKAFNAYEKLYGKDANVFFLEKTIELGKRVNKSKSWIVGRLGKLQSMQPDNLAVIEELADLTASFKWVNKGLKQDRKNGKYPYMMGDHYFDKFKESSAPKDSVSALTWYRKAMKDPQWKNNANAMILTLDPPLTEEEKKRRAFFEGSKKKKEEVKQEGKK